MKRVLAIIALILIVGPVFAQGASEIIGGTLSGGGTGALVGAGIGSLFGPGVGTAIGAFIGGLVGGTAGYLSGSAQAKKNEATQSYYDLQTKQLYTEAYTNAKSTYNQAKKSSDDAEVALMQSGADINMYEDTLARWNDQYNIGLEQIHNEGEADYRQVMGNFSTMSNINSQTGQSGGTADLLARQQRDQVRTLVGDDLRLNDTGGLYGTRLSEYDKDMNASYRELTEQLEIERKNYSNLTGEVARLNEATEDAKKNVNKAAEEYTKNVGEPTEETQAPTDETQASTSRSSLVDRMTEKIDNSNMPDNLKKQFREILGRLK